MEISDKFKKSIFKKLYKDLSHVEIIPYGNSIWFIDRENKYWYFEYGLNGILFWRHPFFNSFFSLFSLESDDYKSIMGEWVEEVLNCNVLTTVDGNHSIPQEVEEVLNYKVHTTRGWEGGDVSLVEEVLNYEVKKTELTTFISEETIKNVLEYSVPEVRIPLEEVLNDNG